MYKRDHTHVQALILEVGRMLAAGKPQREDAKYHGFKDMSFWRSRLILKCGCGTIKSK